MRSWFSQDVLQREPEQEALELPTTCQLSFLLLANPTLYMRIRYVAHEHYVKLVVCRKYHSLAWLLSEVINCAL